MTRIYARGVLDSPFPDPTSFNKKKCTLIIVEIGFYWDFDCDAKIEEKPRNTPISSRPFKNYWGRVEFIAFRVGHAGTTFTRTQDHLTAAVSTIRPNMEHI